MIKKSIYFIVALICALWPMEPAWSIDTPKVSKGRLEIIPVFPSQFVDPRSILIWLPDDYSSDKKYAVLYMNDGLSLFDPNITWNHQEWQVDETASALQKEGKVRDFIVVAIPNAGKKRHQEYFPEKVYRMLSKRTQRAYYGIDSEKLYADEYLAFIVSELKPFIDHNYSVLSDPENTAIMGSSAGGLISIYALAEYPNIFGSAAALSTHWPGFDPDNMRETFDMMLEYLKTHLPPPGIGRLYFDYGNKTLDAYYPPLQARVDALMKELGYDQSNWMTYFQPGAGHNERAWRKRFPIALEFIFPKTTNDKKPTP